MPPSRVSGNELNPPTNATARAETVTTIVNTVKLNPAFGASRIPANPAVAPPIAHVTVARKFGDHPSEETARSFSALAEIASPIRVNRVNAHSANVSTIAMPSRKRRSSWTTTRPIAPSNPNQLVERVVVGREELIHLVEVVVPELLARQSLEHDQHAERRDQSDQRRRAAHEAQDPVLDRDAEQCCDQHRDRDRRADRPTVVPDQRQEAEERAEHRDGAVREVDDPGPAVDEHDALREQRVRRTRPESEDRELNCLSHEQAQSIVSTPSRVRVT